MIFPYSDFVKGVSKPLARVDDAGCRHLLRRAVAAVLAHTGYEGKGSYTQVALNMSYKASTGIETIH